MRAIAILLALALAGCASPRFARTDSVLLITGLGDKMWSQELARMAEAGQGALVAFDGDIEGNPRVIIGHSLGADRAARMAAKRCPGLLVLLDPTRAAPEPPCARVVTILSAGWRAPEWASGSRRLNASHIGLPEAARPILDQLLKEQMQ